MAEPLYDLLYPYFEELSDAQTVPGIEDPVTVQYLNRLSTLQLSALESTEPQSLSQSSNSTLLSLQALSARSSKSLIHAADQLKTLRRSLPEVLGCAQDLQDGITALDKGAIKFSEKYSRSTENEVLDRRKRALMISRNVDKVSDILDLPTLLSSVVSTSTTTGLSGSNNYASALDLYSHIKRLHILYHDSSLVKSIHLQAEEAMQDMTTNLIVSLRAQTIKLAVGMRTVGWLRRIAPELDGRVGKTGNSREGSLGALFLVCRLSNLLAMLEALEPLRNLADRELLQLKEQAAAANKGSEWSSGQQTERYLKRYIEIFREQSFAIISMFNSIFPRGESALPEDLNFQFKSLGLKTTPHGHSVVDEDDPLEPLPSSLATFPLHLVELLVETFRKYLSGVQDKSSRESLLTQVLYCANSLGRLGGDFSMILATLYEGDEDEDDNEDEIPEWVNMLKKHRELSGRLESLASGKGSKILEVDSRSRAIRA